MITIGIDPATTIALIGAYHLIDYVLANREWTKKIPATQCDTLAPNSGCIYWGQWSESTAVVDGNIIGYEDCKFIVSYASRVCLSNPKIKQINILGWSAKWTLWDQWWGNDCPHLKKDVESKPPFDRAKALLEIQKAFFDRISRELFLADNQEVYGQSGQYIECGKSEEIKVMYTLATCNAVLSAFVDTKKGKTEVWRYPIPCKDASCCKFKNTYCWDSNKNEVVSTTEYESSNDELCDDQPNGEYILHILKNIEDNGYTIKNTTITLCVPSCSEYIPSNN